MIYDVTRTLRSENPFAFFEICKAFHLKPSRIKNIELSVGSQPEDNYIHFYTWDDHRLSFPLADNEALQSYL